MGEEVVTPQPSGRARHGFAFVALVALTVALYLPVLGAGWFEIDDARYVPENPNLARLDAASLGRLLSEPYFGNYSPAHLLSYALDRALAGLDPFAFHLSSALWGGLCAALVYALALRLGARTRGAWVAGLLFALHPAHVEAIAWISSRKDLVAAAFAVLATLAYLAGRAPGEPPVPPTRSATGPSPARRRLLYGLSLALFAVATAGKLSVAVLPGALVAFDLLVERRRLLPSLADKLPFAAVVVFVGLRAAAAQPETNLARGPGELAQIGGWLVWLLAGLGDYVIFRPVPDPDASAGVVAAWGLLFVAFAAGPWLVARRALADPAGSSPERTRVGIALSLHVWVLLALLPSQVLGFLYPVSDRYLFFPSVPFVVLLALAAERVLRRATPASSATPAALRAATAVGLVVLAGTWAAKTWSGVRAWADPRSVFHEQVRRVPDLNAHEYLALHDLRAVDALLDAAEAGAPLPERAPALASALGLDGDLVRREWTDGRPRRPATEVLVATLLDRAWAELELAAAIPTPRSLPSLYYRRGRVRDLRGDPAGALAEFERAEREARIHPIEDVARDYRVRTPYAQALMAEKLGDLPGALERMRRAAATDPSFADVAAQVQRLERRVAEGGGG